MYHHPQPTLANHLDQVDNISADSKFNNMFGALSAAAAANFAAVANFASCPASTSTCSPFASQSIPSIVSNPGPCFAPQLVGQPTKRERTKYSEYQLAYLEGIFRELVYPDSAKREEIAQILQLTDVKVQVWFKNRRAKMRNEQKFEKMKREAAKVAATRKQQKITVGAVKREESVEDTEEEDPGKCKIEGAKGAKCKMEPANGNCLKQPPPSPPMGRPYQFGAIKSEEQQIAAAVSTPTTSTTFAHQWPPNPPMMPMEMGSLMQMAAASSAAAAQNQNFYSSWTSPSASNVPNYHLLPSPYGGATSSVAAGQMFNSAMAAAYYPSTNCNYNYYFPPQMSAAMVASTEEQK